MQIETFPFEKSKFNQLKDYRFGLNWPVVYLQENGKEMYIGQTTDLHSRSKQHHGNPERAKLKNIHVLTDEEFNMSAAYDFEAFLIQYIAADEKFTLQNGNGGLVNHKYFDKERYQAKLDTVWPLLKEKGLVEHSPAHIRNTDLFKFSPYKALTPDQLYVADQLFDDLKADKAVTYIVNGAPGSGKTVLALYLLKRIQDDEILRKLNIALVVPMISLRATLQKVLRRVPGMSPGMVIGPADVIKKKYDLLLVDETHRLNRRINVNHYPSYDAVSKKLGLGKEATQLDWIMASSRHQILFYDKKQSVGPKYVRHEDFQKLNAAQYELTSQMRVEGGEDYLNYIDALLELKQSGPFVSDKYEFRFYDDIREMVSAIQKRDKEYGLARLMAGYAWTWRTKRLKGGSDINIDGLELTWNAVTIDWVNSKNAVNEVGCIHTVQGYDLNYAGVIIGPELSYDETKGTVVVNKDKYKDFNGKRSITHPEELQQYVINIYKTLLTRGIKGTYVYVVDEKLRARFQQLHSEASNDTPPASREAVLSPIQIEMIQVPLVGSAPCGNPLLGEENIEEYIPVPKSKIRPGFDYFILRAEGDSMNLADINDNDLLLCRQQQKADTGDRVVALLGGENVTIKEYGPREDGVRLLLPRSTNKSHQPITPGEGDSIQGVVQEVLPL